MNRNPLQMSGLVQACLMGLFFIVVVQTAWVSDDALISFRSIRNLVDGYGLTWNGVERVQAFTHPLWVLIITPAYFITREFFFTVLFLNILISIVCAILLSVWLIKGWRSRIVALLFLSLSTSFVDYSTSGLENSLTHLLLVLYFIWIIHRSEMNGQMTIISLLLSLLFLNRYDVLLIALPSYLLVLWINRRQLRWRSIAVGFFPAVLWLLFSTIYYGFPFPNTAYAKLNTGIDKWELASQGVIYVFDTLVNDPVVLLALILACWVVYAKRNTPLLAILFGVFLYVVYIVYIGGDFMAGRFLTAPFIVTVIIIGQHDFEDQEGSYRLSLAIIVLVGMWNLLVVPESDGRYLTTNSPSGSLVFKSLGNGIADERAVYTARQSLRSISRDNRRSMQGEYLSDSSGLEIRCGRLGSKGLQSPPSTYLIDVCALTDPLLARLPAMYQADWRTGHYYRYVPDGYSGTILSSNNMIQDPQLSEFYGYLKTIVSAELFSPGRLMTIVRMNLGHYNHLVDQERYRYPEVQYATLDEVNQPPSLVVKTHGIMIDYGKELQAKYLLLNYSGERFLLRFFLDDRLIAVAENNNAPVLVDGQPYHMIVVPELALSGFNTVHLLPKEPDPDFRVASIDSLEELSESFLEEIPLNRLLAMYKVLYLRTFNKVDTLLLNEIVVAVRLRDAELDEGNEMELQSLIVDLLNSVRDSEMRTLLNDHINLDVALVDPTGRPIMRVVGYSMHLIDFDQEFDKYLLRLYFEPLSRIEEDYTVWVHAKPQDDDIPLLFDRLLGDTHSQAPSDWQIGRIYDEDWILELPRDSREYQASFGLWDLQNDVRLANQTNGVTWIDLPTIKPSRD